MAITSTSCSQIICQKSEVVSSIGACVAMYHQTLSPNDNYIDNHTIEYKQYIKML